MSGALFQKITGVQRMARVSSGAAKVIDDITREELTMDQQEIETSAGAPQQPDQSSMLSAIPGRMLKVITNPVEFYASDMPKSGGFVEPLVFMVVMAAVTALVMAIAGLIGFGPVGMMAMGFVGVILLPIMVAIFGFIGAAILFVIWKVMGSSENFETAYRCMAFSYAYAPVAALVSGVPYFGALVSALWPMVLMAIASIHVHGRTPRASWAVFGILGLLFAFMGVGAEKAGREMSGSLEGWSQQMNEKYGDPDKMTPEEAGKALGDFMQGFQQRQKEGK